MKFATLRSAVLFSVSVALCGGLANAQQSQTQTPLPPPPPQTQASPPSPFSFRVCNKTRRDASVAIAAHVSATDNTWYAQGWWVVNAGDCSTIGDFTKGWFYYYAKSHTGDWAGSGKNTSDTCVTNSSFKRSDPPGYRCGKHEKLITFNGKFIDKEDTFTWNLE
jgi:uncharacterized membrane protein